MGAAAGTAYSLGRETANPPSVGAGLAGVARATGNAARTRMSDTLGLGEAASSGREAAWNAINGRPPSTGGASASEAMPGWARAMQSEQAKRHHRQVALHALQQGDRGGASATPDIKERND